MSLAATFAVAGAVVPVLIGDINEATWVHHRPPDRRRTMDLDVRCDVSDEDRQDRS